MASVKNTSSGPRGIRTASGDLVMIDAGQSASGDFSAAEIKDFKAALAFEAGGAPAAEEEAASDEPKALSAMNKSELLEAAQADGVTTALDADGKDVPVAEATNKQIAAAVEKARAAK